MLAPDGSVTKVRERTSSKSILIGKEAVSGKPLTTIDDVSQVIVGAEGNTVSPTSKSSASRGKEKGGSKESIFNFLNSNVERVGPRRMRRTSTSAIDLEQSNSNTQMRRASLGTPLSSKRSFSKGFESVSRSESLKGTYAKEEPTRRGSILDFMSNSSVPLVLPALTNATGNPPVQLGITPASLAFKYRLTLDEVQHIFRCWSEMHIEDGDCTFQEFETMLCAVFRVNDIPARTINSAFDATKLNAVDLRQGIENFVSWYVQHMFTSINRYNADARQDSSNAEDYALAKRYNVSTAMVDRIKRKFTQFDNDGSGRIDYEEFLGMMTSLLEVKSADQLDTRRLQKFWKEIDLDGGGDVDFFEFCTWYLKYFEVEGVEVATSQKLISSFYNSFSPTVQRRIALEKRSRSLGY